MDELDPAPLLPGLGQPGPCWWGQPGCAVSSRPSPYTQHRVLSTQCHPTGRLDARVSHHRCTPGGCRQRWPRRVL